MEMSPKAIAAVTFPVVRKGYDPEQVRSFLSQLSRGVEELQNRALQAEAKARLSATPAPSEDSPSVDSITKTLLLAQRTADTTLAEAREEAEGIRKEAADRAESILAEAKAQGNQIITAAEQEALRTGEITRARVAAEVDVLEARRTALSDDVDTLSGHITSQRERVAAAVAALQEALDKPDGLQDVPTPAMTASPAEPPPPALVPPSEGDTVLEPPPTEVTAGAEDSGSGSAFPAPDASSAAGGEQHDPITQEVPTVEQGEPQAWSFFDEGPRSDDRWKR
jgi:DivIVA domain-containing protein